MKPSGLKSRFGAAPRSKSVGGTDVKRQDQSSSMVSKAMSAKGIGGELDEIEGGAPAGRLDRPTRKSGGRACRAIGGKVDPDMDGDDDSEAN